MDNHIHVYIPAHVHESTARFCIVSSVLGGQSHIRGIRLDLCRPLTRPIPDRGRDPSYVQMHACSLDRRPGSTPRECGRAGGESVIQQLLRGDATPRHTLKCDETDGRGRDKRARQGVIERVEGAL